jgi:hypothetical protein
MTSIASIFAKRPESWGYRGDPFLWDALGWQLSARIAQNDQSFLGSVDVHLSQSIVAAIEMKAEKLVSVLQ